MDRLIPSEGTVIVRPFKITGEEKTKSGIIVPDGKKPGKLIKGKIVEVGPGVKTTKGIVVLSAFEVGDTVLYPNNHRAFEYELNDETLLIMPETHIIAKLSTKKEKK